MPAIITSKFRFHNAEQFKESFSEAAPTNYYMFIGRQGEFASSTTGGTDASPPTPQDNRISESRHWDDMMAAKKIDTTGVSHAIPRRDLDTSGNTVYDMYRPNYNSTTTAHSGATNLFDSTFYFVTTAYRVYKVLENNGNTAFSGGAEPTSTASGPFTFGGYTLKYMYTLSTTDVQNFLTPDFLPVPTAPESGNALVDGRLDITKITTAGVGASWATTADRVVTNIPIRGDGTGGRCSITLGGTSGANDGQVTAVSITDNGQDYTNATILPADIIEQHDIQYSSASSNPSLTFSTNPVFEVIIGPDGGHGSNPAKELGGHFIMMDVKLQQTEGFDFSVVNDFRQLGVVRNPSSYGTSSAYTGSTARQTYAIKLDTNSGVFLPDERIFQTIPAQTIQSITVSSNTITVTTAAPHKLTTGQMVDVSGQAFSGGVTNGHTGTHHITVTSTTAFTYTVVSSRAPTGNLTGTMPTYTTFQPEGTVVEYNEGNKVLFYVKTSYSGQGTDATFKQNIPFGGNGQIRGATSDATGVPDDDYSSTLNNVSFTNGYANPEMQPDSGDVIYVENRKPISRASDQTEDVKLIVEF